MLQMQTVAQETRQILISLSLSKLKEVLEDHPIHHFESSKYIHRVSLIVTTNRDHTDSLATILIW